MTKPSKPTPDYPLFAHSNGQWAKKVSGKLHYFGPWDDPQGALARFFDNDWKCQPCVPKQPSVFARTSAVKPAKRSKDYPLYPHASGRWAKKVRGVTRFFGPWNDPEGALNKWLDQKDDLLAGREPRAAGDGLTVYSLVNQFLESKERLVENGEMTPRHWENCKVAGIKLVASVGRRRLVTDLRPADFERLRKEFAKTHGANALCNDVARVRAFFNWGYEQGLIDRPTIFSEFKKPRKAVLRRERHKKGPRLFTPSQIHAMLDKARPQLRAMILLGINCGMGNNDCALLPISALDLKSGWLTYPRPKTGIERRCPLWPETVEALREVLDRRKPPQDGHNYVFVTKYGFPWTPKSKAGDNPISKETAKLLKILGFYRKGLGFYALRHTFETIGGESMDQAAVDCIMGHAAKANDMSAVYRERMTDRRLFRVAKYVRRWLKSKPSQRTSAPLCVAAASSAVAGFDDF